jgi:hypothetical protein
VLNQRPEISAQLLARVQPEAAKIGINVHAIEVKDVMFATINSTRENSYENKIQARPPPISAKGHVLWLWLLH